MYNQPSSLSDQYTGKAGAELCRGCGWWPLQEYPVDLEPPFDNYNFRALTPWDCLVSKWEGPFRVGLFGLPIPSPRVHRLDQPLILPEAAWGDDIDQLVPITIESFPEDEATIEKADQLLRALTDLHRPVAFEVVGIGPKPQYDLDKAQEIMQARAAGDTKRKISEAICGWSEPFTQIQFVAHRYDGKQIVSQLTAQYANSAVVAHDALSCGTDQISFSDVTDGYAVSLQLNNMHCFVLRRFSKLEPDPLGVVIAAFDQLGKRDWGWLQILFIPTRHEWDTVAYSAAVDPFKGEQDLFRDVDAHVLDAKFSSPIFAVVIRVAARRRQVLRQLLGWAKQFDLPPQSLEANHTDTADDLPYAYADRNSYRPGLLLNTAELASMIHLPAPTVTSERLRCVATRTRPTKPVPNKRGSVALGINTHRGKTTVVRIPAELRDGHCYIPGKTRTGKTTAMLNMAISDVERGEAVGVLDPHGDLTQDFLARIPPERQKDVVLFDPTDLSYPPAFNIMSAGDERERERLVSEITDTLQRFSNNPWGDRFSYIFRNASATILHFPKGTLWDVRRILVDGAFRQRCLAKIQDPNVLSFWHKDFSQLPAGAVNPILNRLDVLLRPKHVRNVLCQREKLLDFDYIINNGKIFVAHLPSGPLTQEVSGIYGTFLVSKIISAAFRRNKVPRAKRKRFVAYLDEFHTWTELSIDLSRLLSEAGKFGIVLTMANQFVDQLSPAVRQAILGNVGSFLCFQVGIKDSRLLRGEFGSYTPEELCDLPRYHAIARVGPSSTACNVATYPPPPLAEVGTAAAIRAHCRRHYARPRHVVEASFNSRSTKQSATSTSTQSASPRSSKQSEPPQTSSFRSTLADDEWDSLEDFTA